MPFYLLLIMNTYTTSSSELSSTPAAPEAEIQQPQDEELMAAIQQGDAAALETMILRYRRLLKSAIMRTVSDDASAEDVLQECFLELWRQSSHYSSAKVRPMVWLMTLAKRRAIDHVRRSMAYSRAKDRMEGVIQQSETFHAGHGLRVRTGRHGEGAQSASDFAASGSEGSDQNGVLARNEPARSGRGHSYPLGHRENAGGTGLEEAAPGLSQPPCHPHPSGGVRSLENTRSR